MKNKMLQKELVHLGYTVQGLKRTYGDGENRQSTFTIN